MMHTYFWLSNDALQKDDWNTAKVEIMRNQVLEEVIFYQPYASKDKYLRKQPFAMVIQDDWMRDVATRFSHNNS